MALPDPLHIMLRGDLKKKLTGYSETVFLYNDTEAHKYNGKRQA